MYVAVTVKIGIEAFRKTWRRTICHLSLAPRYRRDDVSLGQDTLHGIACRAQYQRDAEDGQSDRGEGYGPEVCDSVLEKRNIAAHLKAEGPDRKNIHEGAADNEVRHAGAHGTNHPAYPSDQPAAVG